MAWIATDNFDSYSVSDPVEGLNGGSGWSAAWDLLTGNDPSIQAAPAGGAEQGGNAFRATAVTLIHREFSGITAGIVKFRMRISNTSPADYAGIILQDSGGNNRVFIKFASGQIQAFNSGTGYTNIAAASADTWYRVDIEFDDSAQPDQFRVRVDGGAWSSWLNSNGGFTSIAFFAVDLSVASTTLWIDDIGEGSTPDGGGGSSVSPDAAAITLTALAPTILKTLAVPAASMTFTAVASTTLKAVSAPAAAITFTAVAATTAKAVSIPAASITFTAVAATVQQGDSISPDAATITLTALAPTILKTVAAPAASMTFTAVASTTLKAVSAPAAAMTFTAVAATVTKSITPAAATITLTPIAPATAKTVSVPVAALTFTAIAPAIDGIVSIYIHQESFPSVRYFEAEAGSRYFETLL